jgi:hypothetical protein
MTTTMTTDAAVGARALLPTVIYVDALGQPKSPVALLREWQDGATAALAEWQSAANTAMQARQSIAGKERERKLRETHLRLQIADLEAAQIAAADGKRVAGINQDWREAQFVLLCANDDEHTALTTELELLRGNAQLAESEAERARETAHLYRTLLSTLGSLSGYF